MAPRYKRKEKCKKVRSSAEDSDEAPSDRLAASSLNGGGGSDQEPVPSTEKPEYVPRQCLGPDCVKSNRPNSKYCSDNCGMRLAKARLETILPAVLDDYRRNPPNATIRRQQRIKDLEDEINRETSALETLSKFEKKFNSWMEVITKMKPDELNVGENVEKKKFELTCAICQVEVQAEDWMSHMNRCFKHSERWWYCEVKNFEDPYNIFCGKFEKINQNYCVRLRAVCSVHRKGPLFANHKLCGYPFFWSKKSCRSVHEMFAEELDYKTDGFCRNSVANCKQHVNWPQIALSLIEVEMCGHFVKKINNSSLKKELEDEERRRASDAFLMMTNRTINHSEPGSTSGRSLKEQMDTSEIGSDVGNERVDGPLQQFAGRH